VNAAELMNVRPGSCRDVVDGYDVSRSHVRSPTGSLANEAQLCKCRLR
jgi:hypothetical protein